MTEGQTSVLNFIRSYEARFKRTPSGPLNVLLVDDEEIVRKWVHRVLTEAGYRTTIASDGPAALRAAAAIESCDILVTDVMMPGMLGDELARRLREDRPELKVLYRTGYSDRLFKEKFMMWDNETYLDKPCSMKAVQEAVAKLLFGRTGTVATERTA